MIDEQYVAQQVTDFTRRRKRMAFFIQAIVVLCMCQCCISMACFRAGAGTWSLPALILFAVIGVAFAMVMADRSFCRRYRPTLSRVIDAWECNLGRELPEARKMLDLHQEPKMPEIALLVYCAFAYGTFCAVIEAPYVFIVSTATIMGILYSSRKN